MLKLYLILFLLLIQRVQILWEIKFVFSDPELEITKLVLNFCIGCLEVQAHV